MTTATPRRLLHRAALIITAGALLVGLGSTSAQAADTSVHGITVQATGIVHVTPDAVRINLTATTVGATSKAALAATSTTASSIRNVLMTNGVAAKDIASTRVSIYPEYTYAQDKTPVINGYRASQSFNIVIRKAPNAGAILDQIVAAAGDGATIDNVTPFVLDSGKAEAAARIQAVTKARAKAKAYASLLSARLGSVQYLTELTSNYVPGPVPYGLGGKADTATQIDLGQQDVTVSVEVRWNLR